MPRFPGVLAACLLILACRPGLAATYVLTIGGGYSPAGNQISLEKNVQFLQRLTAEVSPPIAAHDVYFADGDAPGRDLQFFDPAHPAPKPNRLMALIFGDENYLGLSYRSHQVPGVRGGASRAVLQQWFAEVGSKLKPEDRLVIYATAHGRKSSDQAKPFATKLMLWNEEALGVSELAGWLDMVPKETPVALVMVQCYSGGFSHLVFSGAEADKGATSANRCGFFATVHDRPAAGCTPDIHEENYQEYSSHFWAALAGKTRTGKPVEKPDYNGDGRIGFDEAHAYVMLVSDTIDIPVKTSDALLRQVSKTKQDGLPDLLAADAAYEPLVAAASPAEKAVLEGLSAQLGLTGSERSKSTKETSESVQKQREQLAEKKSKADERLGDLKKSSRRALKLRWPELANTFDPVATRLLTAEAGDFVAAVESLPDYSEILRLRDEIQHIDDQRLDLERRWVKCQRFLRVAENVALAANLPKLASPEIQERYKQLLAAEAMGLNR